MTTSNNQNTQKIFIAVLLYSTSTIHNPKEKELYDRVFKLIKSTPFLKKYLNTICIDNEYSRVILRKNKVKTWPIFVVNENHNIRTYRLEEAYDVFQKVHNEYVRFYGRKLNKIEECPKLN